MDARIEVAPAEATAVVIEMTVTVVKKITNVIKRLVTMVAASILVPSVNGHSISAVAPDFDLNGGTAGAF